MLGLDQQPASLGIKQPLIAALLMWAITFNSIASLAVGAETVPFERIVGKILEIRGDIRAVHVRRSQQDIQVKPNMWLLYDDVVEVGQAATVKFYTDGATLHLGGGIWNSTWQAPAMRGAVQPSVSALVDRIYDALFDRAHEQSVRDMTSRGSTPCPRSATSAAPLDALERLRQTDQEIGKDLGAIAVAWRPAPEPGEVRARLLGGDGSVLVQVRSECLDTHLILPLQSGMLRAGDRLTLELAEDRGAALRYRLAVVEPDKLPQPPIRVDVEWLLGAWRVAAGPPRTRIDAISRLQTAPPEALGANIISEAIWADTPF